MKPTKANSALPRPPSELTVKRAIINAVVQNKKGAESERALPRQCCSKRESGTGFVMFHSKKAQFYIFTAVVLIAYSTLLLQSDSVIPESSKNFRNVYDNYIFESSQVLNNALFEQQDTDQEYERFLDQFISYSQMKKLSIEVFSILETEDYVYFSNHMTNPVHIINVNETVPAGGKTYFLRADLSEAVLEVRDDVFHENIYKFTISQQGTDAKAVLRVKKGAKREIFVQE